MIVGLVFWGTPDSEIGGVSDFFAYFWVPFLPAGLPYPTLLRGFVTGLIVCVGLISLGGLLSSVGETEAGCQRIWGEGRGKLGGVEEKKAEVRCIV